MASCEGRETTTQVSRGSSIVTSLEQVSTASMPNSEPPGVFILSAPEDQANLRIPAGRSSMRTAPARLSGKTSPHSASLRQHAVCNCERPPPASAFCPAMSPRIPHACRAASRCSSISSSHPSGWTSRRALGVSFLLRSLSAMVTEATNASGHVNALLYRGILPPPGQLSSSPLPTSLLSITSPLSPTLALTRRRRHSHRVTAPSSADRGHSHVLPSPPTPTPAPFSPRQDHLPAGSGQIHRAEALRRPKTATVDALRMTPSSADGDVRRAPNPAVIDLPMDSTRQEQDLLPGSAHVRTRSASMRGSRRRSLRYDRVLLRFPATVSPVRRVPSSAHGDTRRHRTAASGELAHTSRRETPPPFNRR